IVFETDERLRLGEFGIQPRLVKPPAAPGERPRQAEEGRTMVYSTPPPEPEQTAPRRGAERRTRAIVAFDGRRYVLDGPVATIGRSKECDCVIRDPNVSRRHAELRRREGGAWEIEDLGSTNGV